MYSTWLESGPTSIMSRMKSKYTSWKSAGWAFDPSVKSLPEKEKWRHARLAIALHLVVNGPESCLGLLFWRCWQEEEAFLSRLCPASWALWPWPFGSQTDHDFVGHKRNTLHSILVLDGVVYSLPCGDHNGSCVGPVGCLNATVGFLAPAMQQPKSAISTPLPCKFKNTHYEKDTLTPSKSHATCAQWVCSWAENRAILKWWIIILHSGFTITHTIMNPGTDRTELCLTVFKCMLLLFFVIVVVVVVSWGLLLFWCNLLTYMLS